ncbi:Ig-like domain-containing protein [Arthrobacter sp. GMC3]|uniref:L,D-transpeptidase n=1 Tax=Arthrobacter sp. GMC3 TaxID=2058894 RepID=UPI000CE52363|nr:Ig-like domain-containing protein [Arthrobacter sp. GMC3]
MPELEQTKKPRRGWKIAMISVVALVIVGGGVGAATATTWLPAASSSKTPGDAAPTPSSTPKPPAIPVTVTTTPEKGAASVNPGTPVVAQAENGTVSSAILEDTATGETIGGELFVSGQKWISQGPLKFNTGYTFTVTTLDSAGTRATHVSTFTTVPATHEADLVMYPSSGATVGVAQPLEFNFSEPVINKEAVENAIKITSSTGQVGAFHWYSDTRVRYRAADYWPANSAITVEMNLFGVDFGNGMIGNFSKTDTVNIGNKVVMEADATAMSVNIFVNDQLAKTYPVTMGDAAFPSASGFLVITADKQRFATFKASTIGLKPGDPGDYGSVDVEYATRLANSGIFIHQATPSAMPYLGVANLSHGCIGMSAEGAAWVFNNMKPGDLVHAVGTPNETIAPTDGFGDWNIPFEQYASR